VKEMFMMKKETATAYVDSILKTHIRALEGTKTVQDMRVRTAEAFANASEDIKNIIGEIYRDHTNELQTVLSVGHEG
jgi:hypothetical protein